MDEFIADALAAGPTLSVEFFPPKTDKGLANLEGTIDDLVELTAPDGDAPELSFVSITYGAGGSTRDRTRDLVVKVNSERAFPAMPHLTCMGHTRGEIDDLLADYASQGVRNVLALAGDPPADGSEPSGDFTYATELIAAVRVAGDFSIGVAAHPELHPRSTDRGADRAHLADKLNAADFGITQFFFDADDYFTMVDELTELGCTTPVLPGVMPMLNPVTVRRFAGLAGARFPEDLAAKVEKTDSDDERMEVVADAAAKLTSNLLAEGVPGLHLYSLNRSDVVRAVLERVPELGD
ncbi:MAG: methylenetetrahydrofolate reductase [Microthrixaceae bacterium]